MIIYKMGKMDNDVCPLIVLMALVPRMAQKDEGLSFHFISLHYHTHHDLMKRC